MAKREHLIIKLQGPMQAWGKETFEGLRPAELFPGRSALLGLLGACLGIDRTDRESQQALASSVAFAVRVDQQGIKMTDYHTVKDARVAYQGLKSHDNTIQTWREYWQDAIFTVALWSLEQAEVTLSDIEQALKRPVYTPFLGRRSCPLTRPLLAKKVSAENAVHALNQDGVVARIYSEEYSEEAIPLKKRDVPIIHQPRQFSSRMVYMSRVKGEMHVSE